MFTFWLRSWLLQKLVGEYTFLIFLFLMVAFTLFVGRKVPETKNRTFEEIASQFQPGGDIDVEEIVDDDPLPPHDDVFAATFSLPPRPGDVTAGDPVTPTQFTKVPDDDDQQFWVVRL